MFDYDIKFLFQFLERVLDDLQDRYLFKLIRLVLAEFNLI